MQLHKNKQTRNFFLIFAFAVMVNAFLVSSAFAQSLQELRVSGAIGERYDGYTQARSTAAQRIVNSTNAQRGAIYQSRADQQGISKDQVGRVYSKTIFNKAAAGTWFLSETGHWSQK